MPHGPASARPVKFPKRSTAHPPEAAARVARLRHWLASARPAPTETYACPRCGAPVRRAGHNGRAPLGHLPYTPAESIARCPVDGHPLWNAPAVRRVEGDPLA